MVRSRMFALWMRHVLTFGLNHADWWTGELNGKQGFFSAKEMSLPLEFFGSTAHLRVPDVTPQPVVTSRSRSSSLYAEPGGTTRSITRGITSGFKDTFHRIFD